MYDVIEVTGHVGGECYLVVSAHNAVLLDAGLAFCAEDAARNIERALGDRPLDYILLTHSHYDHAAGAPVIKDHFPMAKIVASAHTKTILEKESARTAMRATHAKHARDVGVEAGADRFDDLSVDIVVADGDRLTLQDMTIQAVDAPGHTKCSINFYFIEEGLLAVCETIGYSSGMPNPSIKSGLVISYRMTMDSIARAEALKPKHIILPHSGLIPDEEVPLFFRNAVGAVDTCANFVLVKYKEGLGTEAILKAYKDKYYDASLAKVQSELAFMMNSEAMIIRLLQEFDMPVAR